MTKEELISLKKICEEEVKDPHGEIHVRTVIELLEYIESLHLEISELNAVIEHEQHSYNYH